MLDQVKTPEDRFSYNKANIMICIHVHTYAQKFNGSFQGENAANLSCVMRKPTFWFPTRSDTNQAVQLQKMAKGLKFQI